MYSIACVLYIRSLFNRTVSRRNKMRESSSSRRTEQPGGEAVGPFRFRFLDKSKQRKPVKVRGGEANRGGTRREGWAAGGRRKRGERGSVRLAATRDGRGESSVTLKARRAPPRDSRREVQLGSARPDETTKRARESAIQLRMLLLFFFSFFLLTRYSPKR